MKITRLVAALALLLFAPPALAQSALSQDNRSISVTTGLTFQSIALADNNRLMIEIQNNNTSTDNCWINVDGVVGATAITTTTNVTTSAGVTVTAAKASVLLGPGQAYTRYYPHVPLGPIVGTCATTADSIYVGIH